MKDEMEAIKAVSKATPTDLYDIVDHFTNNPDTFCTKNGCKFDKKFQDFYFNLGPDLNIVCYGLNFIDKTTGEFNTSLKKYYTNYLGTTSSIRPWSISASQSEQTSVWEWKICTSAKLWSAKIYTAKKYSTISWKGTA